MTDDKTMDSLVIGRLDNACFQAEFGYQFLAAPDGTVAVRIADLRHALSLLATIMPATNTKRGGFFQCQCEGCGQGFEAVRRFQIDEEAPRYCSACCTSGKAEGCAP